MEQSGCTNPDLHTHEAFCATRSDKQAPLTPQFVARHNTFAGTFGQENICYTHASNPLI